MVRLLPEPLERHTRSSIDAHNAFLFKPTFVGGSDRLDICIGAVCRLMPNDQNARLFLRQVAFAAAPLTKAPEHSEPSGKTPLMTGYFQFVGLT